MATTWREFWDNGEAYLKTSLGGLGRREKFSPAILYNLLCMSVEGFFMGFFVSHGEYPENHALDDLLDFARGRADLPLDVVSTLGEMNDFQRICSLELYERRDPSWEDVERFAAATRTLRQSLLSRLPREA
jgi:hypothetical protein